MPLASNSNDIDHFLLLRLTELWLNADTALSPESTNQPGNVFEKGKQFQFLYFKLSIIPLSGATESIVQTGPKLLS